MSMRRAGRILVGIVVGLVTMVALLVALPPPDLSRLESHPQPARSYAEALEQWGTLAAADSADVNPECRSQVLVHGVRTRNVLVLLHGLTNCPKQFVRLGDHFHEQGWNVIIVRLPHHGLADRMTTDLARLDAHELVRLTDRVIDVAVGLGDRVTVAGLSLGGVAAAWAGQERAEVRRAVMIAPLFGVAPIPALFTAGLARALLLLPNRFVWWNDRERERLHGPPQVYPRFSTRALGETLRLGFAVRSAAEHRAPAAHEVVLVSIGGDPAVHNGLSAQVVSMWRRHGAAVETYEFPSRLHLGHDVIDPEQVGARIDLVYPELERLLDPH